MTVQMTPERWLEIRGVFDQAISLVAEERRAYLDTVCATDSELRREVESLLFSDSHAGTRFLNIPAVNLTGAPPDAAANRVGCRIGSYVILEEIGRGGMGEVYRASRADGQYEKEVAIKLVRGGFDTAAIIDRFRHERQILASLDHPNIARLLDGGTTEERIPYLVMELIEGTPIDKYCNSRQLNITERLRLFLHVCLAVQYAHQRLVIHRDIKPGNILVTKEGVPKLLDFGVAKLLDPDSTAEITIASPMTPEYASPEQIRGEPITTATDVYSLGVVLYQLLTGRSPYPRKTLGPHELARAICDREPERPSTIVSIPGMKLEPGDHASSTSPSNGRAAFSLLGGSSKLRRRLRGDIDTIVLHSLCKEPQRRYASVEQFAEDIHRHLERLPIIARRDSWRYRAGKFAIRHKIGVAATALVLLAVLGGVTATVREARIAAANQRRAEQRFNDVRKLAKSLMFEIHDSIKDLPGSTSARRLLVTRALEYLDSLNEQSKGDISLQQELAAAYERVGDVLGYPYAANLGDKDGALQSYRKAQAIRESLASGARNDVDRQRDLAGTYFRLAGVLESNGNFAEALLVLGKAREIAQRIAADSKDPVLADYFAGAYYFTASIQVQVGDPAGALEDYQRSASLREEALRTSPGSVPLRTHLAADYAGRAKCLELNRDLTRAVEMQSKAVGILDDVLKSSPGNAMLSEFLGEALNSLATYRKEQGDGAAALETYRKAHQIFSNLLAADPKNSLAKSNVGFSNNGIAHSLIALGNPAAAVKVFRESIATFEEMAPRTNGTRYPRTGLADAYSGMGEAFSILATGRNILFRQRREYWEEAHVSCQKSLALWNDKEKRGELESGERDSAAEVTKCIAISEAQLAPLSLNEHATVNSPLRTRKGGR